MDNTKPKFEFDCNKLKEYAEIVKSNLLTIRTRDAQSINFEEAYRSVYELTLKDADMLANAVEEAYADQREPEKLWTLEKVELLDDHLRYAYRCDKPVTRVCSLLATARTNARRLYAETECPAIVTRVLLKLWRAKNPGTLWQESSEGVNDLKDLSEAVFHLCLHGRHDLILESDILQLAPTLAALEEARDVLRCAFVAPFNGGPSPVIKAFDVATAKLKNCK